MNADNRFSAAAFFNFIEFVKNKHLVKPSKASNWKGATTQFLSILDENEKNDLRNLDIEQLINRYINSKGTSVTSSSLKIYRSRFKGAYIDFISWAEDPINYKPRGRVHLSPINNTKTKKEAISTRNKKSKGQNEEIKETVIMENTINSNVVFPIPISEGRVVTINNLPHELNKSDAEKISAVVRALAMPEP